MGGGGGGIYQFRRDSSNKTQSWQKDQSCLLFTFHLQLKNDTYFQSSYWPGFSTSSPNSALPTSPVMAFSNSISWLPNLFQDSAQLKESETEPESVCTAEV